MKIIDLSTTDSILNRHVAELRDIRIQKDRWRFRRNLERIGELMAYEISKTLDYTPKHISTPLGAAVARTPDNCLVLAAILRAAVPLHQGLLNGFDRAENAFVSAYRKYTDDDRFDIHVEYITSPPLAGKTLVIADPMLATGSSMVAAYRALLAKGVPAVVHIAAVIASRQALDFLECEMADAGSVTLWVAAVDEELNGHSYIIPGLGDAGDLAYGEKE